jgi:hypothetical protein
MDNRIAAEHISALGTTRLRQAVARGREKGYRPHRVRVTLRSNRAGASSGHSFEIRALLTAGR